MKNVRELLQGSVVLLDGAMGTMLQRGGLPAGERPELLNLSHPEQITAIHRAYVEQGAQIIYTNTFGANERKLAGTGASVEQVITAGVKAAARQNGIKASQFFHFQASNFTAGTIQLLRQHVGISGGGTIF